MPARRKSIRPVSDTRALQKAHTQEQNRLVRTDWASYIPILHWLPQYQAKELLAKDLACGFTLGCVLISQSLAHATLCGVSVEHGPYSCLLGPLVYAILGSCHQASMGTGGLIALLTGLQLAPIEDPLIRAKACCILCLLVGLILTAMGFFKLSFIVRFLSRPALSGFITGSALLIMKGMTMPMLGLPKELAAKGVATTFIFEPENLLQCNKVTVGLSVTAFLFLYFAKKILPKAVTDFKELIVLVACGVFIAFFGKESHVQVVGAVPAGLPAPVWPLQTQSDFMMAKDLFGGAFLIAMVTFISSFAAAKKCALQGGYHVIALNELLGLGFGNLAGAFIGAVPTQIGLSRSALASGMGVKTQLGSNVFVAATIALIIMLFGPLLAYVPSCVLNAIIFNAATHLFEFDQARKLWGQRDMWSTRKDLAIWWIAFVGTVWLGAFQGICAAVAISLGLAIQEVVNPQVEILGHIGAEKTWVNITRFPEAKEWNAKNPTKLVLRINGPLFYANCERFQDQVAESELAHETLEVIVLSASSISFVDATALQILSDMVKSFRERHILFYIANAYGEPLLLLERYLCKEGMLDQTDLTINVDACMELADTARAALQADVKVRLSVSLELGTESPQVSQRERPRTSICPLPSIRERQWFVASQESVLAQASGSRRASAPLLSAQDP